MDSRRWQFGAVKMPVREVVPQLMPSYRSQLYLLLAPYVLGMTVLILGPMLITLALSFTQYDIFSPPQWIGLTNFRHFLVDRLFQRALYNSLWFVLIAVPLRAAGALLLALALTRRARRVRGARGRGSLPAR